MGSPMANNEGIQSKLLATEVGVYKDLCESAGTPRAVACYMLAAAGEFEQLLTLPSPERDVRVNSHFPDDYLVTEALRKNPRLPLKVNRRLVAARSWCAAERRNRQTNAFLRSHSWSGNDLPSRAVRRARRRIARVLGPLDALQFDEILSSSRHGPGATSTVRGKNISPATKMITPLGVTPTLWTLRHSITPLWQDETVGFVPELWDTWINVPKNALTDRGICINPGLNVYVQLGVGSYIRKRLKTFGLDIRKAQSRHRWLVKLAQRLKLATIDLSSASDCISYELVKLLVPKRWFHLLEMLRTSHTRIKGQLVDVAKFAAMGNGFTFELETLIFWAISVSVNEILIEDGVADVRLHRFVSVYGDDIIVPQDSAAQVIEVLTLLGFSTNARKTFLAGGFFESCGSDVWEGEDVRPLYLDADPRDMDEAVILLANAIRLYAARRGAGSGCDKRFLRPWLRVVSKSRIAQRTGMPVSWERRDPCDIERAPSISAASGLIRNFDEYAPRAVSSLKGLFATWDGFVGRMYYFRPKNFKSRDSLYHVGCYIVALHSGTPDQTRAVEFARGSVHVGRLKSTICPQWADIGPWVDLQGRRG